MQGSNEVEVEVDDDRVRITLNPNAEGYSLQQSEWSEQLRDTAKANGIVFEQLYKWFPLKQFGAAIDGQVKLLDGLVTREIMERCMAMAQPNQRVIAIQRMGLLPDNFDDWVYSALMHEMGHLVHPRGAFGNPTIPLESLEMELAAWDWALEYARTWTPVNDKALTLFLFGYFGQLGEKAKEADPNQFARLSNWCDQLLAKSSALSGQKEVSEIPQIED